MASSLQGFHLQEKLRRMMTGNPAGGGGDRPYHCSRAATTLSTTRQFLEENRPSNVNFTAEVAGDSAAVFETISLTASLSLSPSSYSSSAGGGGGYREPDSAAGATARGKLKPMSA